jgi:hypothetical protein
MMIRSRLLDSVRRVFPRLLRDRHYAAIDARPTRPPLKLEPIAKILADAGRDSTTLAD